MRHSHSIDPRFPLPAVPFSRNRYYDVLHEAQVKRNLRPFIEFIIELFKESQLSF